MTAFDPDKFEDKYVHYLRELQQAYRDAFETMNERRDSQLVHAIDQQVLNESEPFFEGEDADPAFRIELPENPYDRLSGVIVDRDRFEDILDEYVTELQRSLEAEFLK